MYFAPQNLKTWLRACWSSSSYIRVIVQSFIVVENAGAIT